jgi:predicted transcriptional regulator
MQKLRAKPSRQEQKLIDRFIAAFNAIDKQLKSVSQSEGSFGNVIKECLDRSLITRKDYQTLKTVTTLRNILVHDTVKTQHFPVVPTAPFVDQVERLLNQFRHPARVIPTFRKEVKVVDAGQSLSSILKLIDKRDYSQFPVFDDARFKGLLTENGITRWLAHHVSKELSLVELDEITVRMVLREEEKRSNYQFVSKGAAVNEVKGLFSKNELLEAVLITTTGSPKEDLLGIATRWDIVQLH